MKEEEKKLVNMSNLCSYVCMYVCMYVFMQDLVSMLYISQ
jgi:hypothetical protein